MAYTTIDDPTIYFNTVTYTGNGGSQSVTGVGFEPDLVWLKSRSLSQSHFWSDVIRGAGKVLISNNNDAEQNFSANFTALSSDGYTLANGTNGFNASSATYVSWNWKAGGSASSNSDGSITSSVSANTTAGFSIVSYTGTGSAATIGHGLGVKPDAIIVKNREATENWMVYQKTLDASAPEDYYILLNGSAVRVNEATTWNDTAPTTSLFTVGSHDATNKSGVTYIAYCFAEKQGYSKFGSFVGNGNANGPFIYTGFKPAWVMIKANDSENWIIFDNKRPGYNLTDALLKPNLSNAESTSGVKFDMLSNGFKVRVNDAEGNGNGNTNFYFAFAESPFVNSNGIPNNAR